LTFFGGDRADVEHKSFTMSIAVNTTGNYDLKLAEVEDSVNHMIVADAGACTDHMNPGHVAYPDCCAAECNSVWCAWADWEACYDYCGSDFIYLVAPGDGAWAADSELMKPFTRHLGGSNVGFLDGHAAWWSARAWVAACREAGQEGDDSPFGMWPWGGGYPTWCDGWDPGIHHFYE